MGKGTEETANPAVYGELETVILSWRKQDQQEYLKRLQKPVYGSKEELAARIMAYVPFGDAVKITKNYRQQMLERRKMSEEEKEGDEELEDMVDVTDVEMTDLEKALKRKREIKPAGKQKIRTPPGLTSLLAPPPRRCTDLRRTEIPM